MPKPEGWDDINALPSEVEVISCPNCHGSHRLEFRPMLEGWVWAQCPCGFGWDMAPVGQKRWVN